MDAVNAILESAAEQTDPRKSTVVNKDVELDIDEGMLLASDYNVLDLKILRSQGDTYLKRLTRDNVQLMINKIWALPTERIEEAIVAKLPKPTFVLPRARALPKPKPLTKWQQFAKEKGIRTKKKGRSKLKWDEELQKWIPTYGYKQAKTAEQKDWLVEVGQNTNPMEDPFTLAKNSKEERKSKNELQRLRNLARAKNVKLPKVGLPSAEHFQNSRQIATAVTVARTSTASLGKYQARLPKEKDAKGIAQEVPGLRKRPKEPLLNFTDEKRRNTGIVNDIIKNNTKILRDDLSTPTTTRNVSTSSSSRKKVKGGKGQKGGKKPKAGKGKRDLHTKVGGRKRR